MRLYSPSLAKWVFFKSPHFSWLSYRVIFLQKQLISLGTRHISNFYLDWVTVDFSVRMDKVHEGFHFSSAVLLFCFCHFTCVSFCESRTQNEEGSGSEAGVIGKGFSSIWLLDELVFCSTSSLKTSVDSWLPRGNYLTGLDSRHLDTSFVFPFMFCLCHYFFVNTCIK
nr:uncharacterized protein LOC114820482 isoform X1 [Malus domestica]